MKVTIAADEILDPAETPALPYRLDFVAYDDVPALEAFARGYRRAGDATRRRQ